MSTKLKNTIDATVRYAHAKEGIQCGDLQAKNQVRRSLQFPLAGWSLELSKHLFWFRYMKPIITAYTVISWKSAHGWNTLQVCQRSSLMWPDISSGYARLPKKGVGTLLRVSPFNHKEHPCYIYSDSIPLKQIIRLIITCNRITSSFEVESWQHTTLWTTLCHHKHGAVRSVHCISLSVYTKMPRSNLWWSTTQSFLPQICRIVLEVVLVKLHGKLSHRWALIRVNFDLYRKLDQ